MLPFVEHVAGLNIAQLTTACKSVAIVMRAACFLQWKLRWRHPYKDSYTEPDVELVNGPNERILHETNLF